VLTTLAAPNTCRADPSSDQAASQQVRYRQAHEAFKAGKWLESRRLLLDLWKEKQTFDVAVTLVQVEYQLAHYAAAARYLRFALDNIPPTEKPETVRDFKQQLEELRAHVGTVTVHVDADAAEISVDEEQLGKSPLEQPIFLDPGNHSLKARLADRTADQQLKVVGGGSYSVDLKVPVTPTAIQSGLPEHPTTPQADRPANWWTTERSALLGVGGGLTLLAASFAIAYRIDAGNEQDNVDRLKTQARNELGGNCPAGSDAETCRALEGAARDRNSSNKISNISFAISGVLLAATATAVFLWPGEKSAEATANVAPVAGPGFAGVSVKGAF
jgi:hypothetical protein